VPPIVPQTDKEKERYEMAGIRREASKAERERKRAANKFQKD
jgi:hypothetical protein